MKKCTFAFLFLMFLQGLTLQASEQGLTLQTSEQIPEESLHESQKMVGDRPKYSCPYCLKKDKYGRYVNYGNCVSLGMHFRFCKGGNGHCWRTSPVIGSHWKKKAAEQEAIEAEKKGNSSAQASSAKAQRAREAKAKGKGSKYKQYFCPICRSTKSATKNNFERNVRNHMKYCAKRKRDQEGATSNSTGTAASVNVAL